MANYTIPKSITDITNKTVEDYAREQTSSITDYNNKLLQQYEQIAESQKNALNLNKENAVNQINSQRDTVNQNALQEAKQAYINKMLAQKDMKQTLSQSGLSTTGTTGTAYGGINNSYGENLNNITMNKNNALKNIDNQVNTTNLTYAQKEQDLLADIASTRLQLSQNNSDRYQQAYQQAVNNYMQYKDYEAKIASLYQAQQELDQSWKKYEMDYDLAMKNYELALSEANKSTSSTQSLLQELLSNINSEKSTENNEKNVNNISSKAKEFVNSMSGGLKSLEGKEQYQKTVEGVGNSMNKLYQAGVFSDADIRYISEQLGI